MKKRSAKLRIVLSAVFVTCLFMFVCTTAASAATYGDLTYQVIGEEVTVTDCDQSARQVVIPDYLDGYPVTSIGDNAFDGCTGVTSISIPDSVTNIGIKAFFGCTTLNSINIPDGVTNIMSGAFGNCSGLTRVGIPLNVTMIEDYAFFGASNISDVYYGGNEAQWIGIIEETNGNDGLLKATVHYGCASVPALKFITIKTKPAKINYYIGDSLDTAGMVLELTYSDGTVKTVTDGYTTSGFDSATGGTNSVTVTYEGKSATFSAAVKTPSVALNAGSKTLNIHDTYLLTATSEPSATVVWTSSDETVATVEDGTVTAKSAGTAVITAEITYNEKTYTGTCTVTVKPAVLKAVAIKTKPAKINYYIGDSLDTAGMVLELTYSDGTVKTVTDGYTTSGFDSAAEGTKSVTVTYEGKSASYSVSVKTPTVALNAANKTMDIGYSYTLVATPKPSATVTWTSSDESVATVEGGTVTAKSAGTAVITAEITYNSKTYTRTCTVTVKPIVLKSISIRTKPTKLIYYFSENLSTSGLSINLAYSDGTVKTATSGYTTSGFSSESVGTKTVTVTYEGKSAKFSVAVKEPTVDLNVSSKSIMLDGQYTIIATPHPSGKTVKWSSSNTSVATVSSSGIVTPKSAGTATITAKIAHDSKWYETTCTITVVNSCNTHKYINHAKQEPTCTEIGWKAYVTCQRCGISNYEDRILQPLGHRYAVKKAVSVASVGTVNDSTYPFTKIGTTSYRSTNNSYDTESVFTINAYNYRTLKLEYSVSSEEYCDCFIVKLNGSTLFTASGYVSWTTKYIKLEPGDILTLHYVKDGSASQGYDRVTFKYTCNPLTKYIVTDYTADELDDSCTDVKCSYCTEIVKEGIGHSWGEWNVISEPTGTSDGYRVHRCTKCNASEGEHYS